MATLAIKFNLSGTTAFFKKPDMNQICYTYNTIHKVALMGILGSILGLGGYNQQERIGSSFPEFYEKLNDTKIAIVPLNEKGYVEKKIQTFINQVGYANLNPGPLIVKEQWMENPSWEIYIMLEKNLLLEELKSRLLENRYTFLPYLGKNDHPADIKGVEILEMSKIDETDNIDSYFKSSNYKIKEKRKTWKIEDYFPTALEETANIYLQEKLTYTNAKVVKIIDNSSLYKIDGKVIEFF